MHALAPFRTRSFRFLWPADLCTAWAMEMETLILGWYVLVETGSVVLLTLFGSLMYVGTLVSPVVGMLGDRLGLGRVLGALRLAYAFFAGVILLSAFSGQLSPTLVLVVAALAGVVRPSDIGMRSALISATLPAQHLVAALSVSRTTQDSARICGALAGAGFMAAFGMTPAYVVITALYVGAALMTLYAAVRGPAAPPAGVASALSPALSSALSPAQSSRLSPWREVKEGLAHVWHTPRLRAAMSLAALVNLNAFPLTMGLMPYTAREVFQLDQRGLGWLVASFACGALIGSLALSAWGRRLPQARVMLAATLAWYLCLGGFVLATSLQVALVTLLLAGVAQSLSMVTLSIILLRTTEERFRGRIMGVRMLAIYTLPLGLMAAGALIPLWGYRPTGLTFVLTGLVLTLAIAAVWRDELVARGALANAH
jgi:predicted MFS family arabinose efflux permease